MTELKAVIEIVNVLNIDRDESTISALGLVCNDGTNEKSFVVSDADEELLILISFKEDVDLKCIKIHSLMNNEDVSGPKQIHVYKIKNMSINFDDLTSMKSDQTIKCNRKKLKKGQFINLQKTSKNAITFKDTKYLAIYIDSNQTNTDNTIIHGITLKGSIRKERKAISANTESKEEAQPSASKCVSIKTGAQCDHVNRCMDALIYYQSLDIENDEKDQDDMMKKFNEEMNITFLDDYTHIILNHNHEIEDIYNIIMSETDKGRASCDLKHCLSAMRHHRDRHKDIEIKRDQTDSRQSKEFIFWRDVLDSFHCYLYHLYDFGLRVKMDDIKQQNNDDQQTDFDAVFASICSKIELRKQELNKLKHLSLTRYQSNKFNLNIDPFLDESESAFLDGFYLYLRHKHIDIKHILWVKAALEADEYESDSIKLDMKTPQVSNIKDLFQNDNALMFDLLKEYMYQIKLSAHSFKIGYRFNYWKYYRDLTEEQHRKLIESTNVIVSISFSPKEFYIESKYESLKDEILNNKIYPLKHDGLDVSIHKAHQYIDTQKARKITSLNTDNTLHYGINERTPLSIHNILSVLLYTDWSDLSTAFSGTFRPKSEFETLSSVKSRNREFAVWSRVLRETVQCFGNIGDPKEDQDISELSVNGFESGPFFCGVSSIIVVPEFNIRLNAPTSTTKQIEVSKRFGGDHGMTIQLNNNGYDQSCWLTSWNCSWLSSYTGEDERIWMGGDFPIKIETVLIIQSGKNYCKYFKPLYYFDCMMTGVAMLGVVSTPSNTDYEILCNLWKYKMKETGFVDKYPKYIRDTFNAYTNNKKQIVINIQVHYYHFGKLSDLIMNKIMDKRERETNHIRFELNGEYVFNLLKPTVFKLFNNLKSIVIMSTGYSSVCTLQFEFDILSLLSLLDESSVCMVTIRAEHQYVVTEHDKYNDSTITKVQHIGISWLFSLWKKSSELLTTTFEAKKWNISLETDIKVQHGGSVDNQLEDHLTFTRYGYDERW